MPRCKLPNCPVAKDGRCLEGRGASCPNLITEPEVVSSDAQALAVPSLKVDSGSAFEPLPRTDPLEVAEARYFSRRGRAIVVALAGMRECGKTSLLARLHQLFQSGPLSDIDFAGSRSLPLFEELNWLATVQSGAPQPRMLRSSAQFDNSFIHLSVRPSKGGPRVDLLLNDISGETFERAVAAQSSCDKLLALSRADHLVLLVDGAVLAGSLCHHHVSQTNDFLIRVLQGRHCGTHTALEIVVSKLDELKDKSAIVDKLEADFQAAFRGKFGSFNFWRIAARPMDGSLPTIKPIAELFASIVQTTHRYPEPILPSLRRDAWVRDFCRYGS